MSDIFNDEDVRKLRVDMISHANELAKCLVLLKADAVEISAYFNNQWFAVSAKLDDD